MSLLDSMGDLCSKAHSLNKVHTRLLSTIDNLEITSVPEYPLKFMIDISSFEEIAGTVNLLCDKDTEFKQFLDSFKEDLRGVQKIKLKTRKLKLDLSEMKERLEREEKYFNSSLKRVQNILSDFKQRCRNDYTEYLKNIDFDLRLILKPLVPSSVIKEAVKYPEIQEILDPTPRVSLKTENSANKDLNALLDTVETTSKELIDLLEDVNRKYYEIVDPQKMGTRQPTPLAAPLPDYFTYTKDSPRETKEINKKNLEKLRKRVNKLYIVGEITKKEADLMNKRLGDGSNLHLLFQDLDISLNKREDIVFKLVTPGVIKRKHKSECVRHNDSLQKCIDRKELPVSNENNYFSTPRTAKIRRSVEFHKMKMPFIRRSEKRVSKFIDNYVEPSPPAYPAPDLKRDPRVRSITPVETNQKKNGFKNIKFLIKHLS